MGEYHEKMNNVDGEQLGDPDKIAGAFLQLLNSSNPATNLFLVNMHLTGQKLQLNKLIAHMESSKGLFYSTDFRS